MVVDFFVSAALAGFFAGATGAFAFFTGASAFAAGFFAVFATADLEGLEGLSAFSLVAFSPAGCAFYGMG